MISLTNSTLFIIDFEGIIVLTLIIFHKVFKSINFRSHYLIVCIPFAFISSICLI